MTRSAFITAWIVALAMELGAAEPARHWAFQPPKRPAIPEVSRRAWPVNPIDHFILAELEARQLAPSPRADSATLLRRATLDLTGLPPSLAEQAAARPGSQPVEWQHEVERLLASPRYGERMATPWLDAARFADTHGYLIDAHRAQWRWRDWVIEAFNANLPFDQFTILQLAGDLLPNPSTDQRIATGFNRNHMVNYENGADPDEYRADYVADRSTTTAAVWMGLTFHCARCHDHKYDPFTLKEFYQWSAFFDNVDELGLDGNLGNAVPVLASPTVEQERQLALLDREFSATEGTLRAKRAALLPSMADWEVTLEQGRQLAAEPQDVLLQIGFELPERLALDANRRPIPSRSSGELAFVSSRRGHGLLLDGATYVELPTVRWPESSTGMTFSAWVFPTTADAMLIASHETPRVKQQWELKIDNFVPVLQIAMEDRDNDWISRLPVPLAHRKWQHLAIVWDGGGERSVQWYRDGLPVVSEHIPPPTYLPGILSGKWYLGGASDRPGFRGLLDEIRFYPRVVSAAEIAGLANADLIQATLSVPIAQRSADQLDFLCDLYARRVDPDYARLAESREQLIRRRSELVRTVTTTMVMRERVPLRPTHVLQRGRFDRPGEQVHRATPAALPPFDERFSRDRLGLAQWLMDPNHPLTARVAVNRIWQMLFGAGLVRTPEDFGVRGQPPTHPKLLDWLAIEFIESNWDVKHMVRLIVNSATYCQSSRCQAELWQRDPENHWLGRSPRLRLEAEAVRDMLLSVSGLLDSRIGGASVFPRQPPGLWEEVSFNPDEFSAQKYLPSQGGDLYRRGLYTFRKRTLPPPALAIFDAPTRETCVLNRDRSNTPLQALVMMNDPGSMEAARSLAARALREYPTSPESVVHWMFRSAISRVPTAEERRVLLNLFQQQQRWFQESQAAEQLLSSEDSAIGSPAVGALPDASALAAWTIVASVLLSLDETITRN